MIASGITSIHTAVETDSIRSALEIVASTTSLPPCHGLPPTYLEDKLVFLRFDSPHFKRPVGIVKRRDTADHPLQEQFYAILKAGLDGAEVDYSE